MKFLVLVLGILVFVSGGAWFTLTHSVYAIGLALAGMVMAAGEVFKIAAEKELQTEQLEDEEKKLEDAINHTGN